MEHDFVGEFGKVCFEDFLGFVDHQIHTRPGCDSTQQQQVFEFVKVAVLGQRLAQIDTHGAVDGCGALIFFSHQLLHTYQLFGEGHALRDFDAS
jgi:hypothetical protein